MSFPLITINSSTSTLTTLLLSSLILAVYFKKRSSNVDASAASPIKKLHGPPSPSWLAGNFPAFLNSRNAEDQHVSLIQRFGLACRVRFIFNTDVLYLADPKGLQYVLNTSGYNFHKRQTAKLSRMFFGKNLLGVEGEEHARQRKILLPSFSQSHMREIVPAFVKVTSKLTERWRDLIINKEGKAVDVDMYVWLSRLTMDALGEGVLSYDFGALSDTPSKYVEAFRGLFVHMFDERTDMQFVMQVGIGRIPEFIGQLLMNASVTGMNQFQRFITISNEISNSIIAREKEAVSLGKPASKDLLSVLVRANMDLDPKARVTDDELLAQITAFTLAGHDTTSSQLQWVFYELSRHPEAQVKIREEIKAIKEAKGVQELGPSEMESLQYTAAVLKETLRCHPIAPLTIRQADRDDIIPLAYPVKETSGKEVNAIHIKRGQQVFISIYGYNFVKDLWGADADEWNPERFIRESEAERSKRTLGVYAHLASFSSGVHACIGWRFALLGMMAIVTGLVEHFEFAPIASNPTILRKMTSVVYPCVEGEEDKKAQMPLSIRSVL